MQKHIQREAMEQTALFEWAQHMETRIPELKLLYHIPNGGSRNMLEAVNLKRQGVKAGVPDLCLPVARGGCHGLYIEMKAGKNVPTSMQVEWLTKLSQQGYATYVCYSWTEAKGKILNYLQGARE